MIELSRHPLAVLLGLGLWAIAAGCGGPKKKGPPPKRDFKIEVEVTDTRDKPVSEAPVLVDGKRIGYTDRDGKFVARLREHPGRKVELAIGDMKGYRFVNEHKTVEKLKVRRRVTGEGRQAVGIPFSVKVKSTTKPYLIWIRTVCDEDTLDESNCRGLPIKRNGEIVTRTDRTGRAHFAIEEEPQTDLTVMIDTPESEKDAEEDEEAPTFKPKNPTFDLELALEPKVYVIEQSFEDPTVEERTWEPPPNYDPGGSSDDNGGSSESSSSSSGAPSANNESNSGGRGSGGNNSGGNGSGSSLSGGDDSSSGDDGPIKLFE